MRILSTGLGWNEFKPGGLNRYFVDYISALKETGHSEQGIVIAERDEALDTDLNIVNVAGNELHSYARMRRVREQTLQSVEAFRPDVFNPHFAMYAALVSRRALPEHVPIVTHFHGPWASESKMEDGGKTAVVREARYQMKKQLEKMTYRKSDSFIVLSEYARDLLAEQYGIDERKVNIIPGAVEHQRFVPHPDRAALRLRLGIPGNEKLLFCARRIVRRMGIDILIEAMQTVVRQEPNTRLLIAGDGPMRQSYEALISEYGLKGKVEFLGRVSNDELVEWYQAADLSLVPTITLEGFGLVTVESLACGTPVLGTPFGGTREILSKLSNDLLFRDGRAQSMSDSIIAACRGELAVPTRDACREHVLQHYTWECAAKAIVEVFEQEREKRRLQSAKSRG
ncbi:glycosyltransferase family 4 protein [Paenibacillus sp. NEAU-GSW1]|uniref:glycosyltransferase family 4 protein n=1 Tax=Paenibacillus sp. NEAU-GSW1 TaxID=2682486 RepID=UPI0012E0DA1C|nr:glycosyltransferase family 4 protein [Paenibacillus sp. NEAU-GSW1]MUT68053.1 glycosyltransferase [Paenibacillus sp. NEAU-GSW1]